ncbi:MAG TPA: superoxide dismutase family protein [Verrucomicrobiae bacterium]|nr:superoxide dismutase family protein [Verrucomicrobiae bacterium]
MNRPIAASLALLLLSGAAVFAQESPKHSSPKPVTVEIINTRGHSIGTAELSQTAHGVKISLTVRDLPPGPHLMHIHEFPKCEPPDFKSAGPHFNSSGAAAGNHAPTGVMAGDIPNFVLTVAADGTAHATTIAPYVTLGAGGNSVFTNGGTSIVIHDVAEQVSASAPPRIACGVIKKQE